MLFILWSQFLVVYDFLKLFFLMVLLCCVPRSVYLILFLLLLFHFHGIWLCFAFLHYHHHPSSLKVVHHECFLWMGLLGDCTLRWTKTNTIKVCFCTLFKCHQHLCNECIPEIKFCKNYFLPSLLNILSNILNEKKIQFFLFFTCNITLCIQTFCTLYKTF